MTPDGINEQYANPDIGLHVMRERASWLLKENFCSCKDVYQFGVWGGHSMVAIQKLWARKGLTIRRLWGFDSFEGLPEEVEEPAWDNAWTKGNFSAKADFGVNTVEEAIERVLARLDRSQDIRMVPGFWEKTLSEPISDLGPAAYVDIDCDIYTSTVLVHQFLERSGILADGTLIGYHDYGAAPAHGGQRRAIAEWVASSSAIRLNKAWDNGANALFWCKFK